MSQVRELSRQAGISEKILARKILGVSRASFYIWERAGVPSNKITQLETLKETLQYYLKEGLLPVDKEELTWNGILHLTECINNPRE